MAVSSVALPHAANAMTRVLIVCADNRNPQLNHPYKESDNERYACVRYRNAVYISYIALPAVLQRVNSASVTVDKQLISSIGRGILVFAGVGKDDTEKDADSLAAKILKARLWPDDANASVRR